jgi:hypothetical protein
MPARLKIVPEELILTDWTDVVQNTEQWLSVVSAVMNFRVAKYAGEWLISQATVNV